ncbi:GNAT family N-acetyltransferase [Serinicoccus sp. CNJ-927]|uniref:GNAT family N-acetyltransferase n=1 Tax=unclassified Serinicoccus TaxID=2643101 RepID=UPI0009675A70|nr:MULTISPECIES: GNAT family N-acetyltransferase [unclassified Serinicoccus]OLT17570.1 GNAT family N-acetyltransferase [Serinicoccus sp. CUA-874]OLT42493.1 GNAT family N-acetyltransferase [Serinicoccus sp. CNJ-927]
MSTIRAARFADLDNRVLHDLLRLRVDVFVVEQECAYPEIDGRDVEETTVHLWTDVDGGVAATVRILVDDDGTRHLGRVATHRDHRGQGYAAALLREGLDRLGPGPVHLGAQAHLEQWYARLGFRRSGPDYLEDGIPHLPMVRD